MSLTQPQRITLARLLAHLRPDWDDAGIHAACNTLAELDLSAAQLCARATLAADIETNRTPTAITWAQQYNEPPTQDQPCSQHGGTIRRPDGRYHCCVIDTWWPDHEWPHPGRPIPVDVLIEHGLRPEPPSPRTHPTDHEGATT